MIDIIKDFCVRELNLNEAAASGMVANMTAESGLRTTALGDGGTSYLVCDRCGTDKVIRDFAGDVLPITEWMIAKNPDTFLRADGKEKTPKMYMQLNSRLPVRLKPRTA